MLRGYLSCYVPGQGGVLPPAISNPRVANFGPGRSNRRIKSPGIARVVAAVLAGLCLGVFAAHAQTPQTKGGKGGDAVAGTTAPGGTGGADPGSNGAGGAGVVGTGFLLTIDSGTISGGLAGGGNSRANAVDFSGGHNTLELLAGFKLVGNAVSKGASIPSPPGVEHFAPGGDTLALGGTEDSSFNVVLIGDIGQVKAQYQGFGRLVKTGTSTW